MLLHSHGGDIPRLRGVNTTRGSDRFVFRTRVFLSVVIFFSQDTITVLAKRNFRSWLFEETSPCEIARFVITLFVKWKLHLLHRRAALERFNVLNILLSLNFMQR